MIVRANGYVGLGIISPAYKLDVSGEIRASNGFRFGDGTVQTTAASSTSSAANIASGQFGQNTGGGNYTFPGNVTVTGNIAAKYQDIAEWVESSQELPPGTVVILDSTAECESIGPAR